MSTTQGAEPSQHHLDDELAEVSRGISKAFENARELSREAALLRSHGALSRSLFLHQISMEECGKIEILGATAVSLIADHETELSKVAAALTRHKAKNRANAYLLPLTDEEEAAAETGDWERALRSFSERQADFHAHSNTAKNASLYVDFSEHRFTAPAEVITEDMVEALAILNYQFLELAEPKVRMVARWTTDRDETRKTVVWFLGRAEGLKSQPDMDPREALSLLMSELRERHGLGGGEDGA